MWGTTVTNKNRIFPVSFTQGCNPVSNGPWWQIIRLCSVDNLPCFFGTFEHFGIIHYDAASTCYLCLVTQHTPTNTYVRAERPWWRQWSDLNITRDENNCDRDCAIKTFVSKKPKLYRHTCSTRRKRCLNPVWEKKLLTLICVYWWRTAPVRSIN